MLTSDPLLHGLTLNYRQEALTGNKLTRLQSDNFGGQGQSGRSEGLYNQNPKQLKQKERRLLVKS